MTRRAYPSEHQIQASFIQWMRLEYPTVLVIAIPNDGLRSPVTGRRFKARGLLPGTPDVFVARPSKRYGGLWIEFKRPGGRVTEAQEAVMLRLRASGYAVAVCHSLDEAIDSFQRYLSGG